MLGENRYADLQTARRLQQERIQSFIAARAFTKNLDLPSTAANDLLLIQAELGPRLAALTAAQAATPAERHAQIAALAREAQAKLTWLLGESGFARYQADGMGAWLNAAVGPTPPPAIAP